MAPSATVGFSWSPPPHAAVSLHEAALAAASAFDALDIQYALIGGIAVSTRTEPRFTQDLDWVVAVQDDAAAERVVHGLTTRGYVIDTVVENEARNRMSTVRMEVPTGGWLVDLLFASSGIEPEIVAAAEPIEAFAGFALPVARTGHLIALKLLARGELRPLDTADIQALIAVADDDEIALARTAVELIEARGYDRGRDLRSDLASLLAPSG